MRTLECETCCEQSICNSVECQPPSTTTTTTMATTTTLPTAITTSSLWSVWSSWTHCPYSCGHDGIQHRFRHCLDQDPRVCTGNKFDTKICHTRVCCTNPPVITYIDSDQFVFTRSFLVLYCNATNFDTLSWRIPEVVGHSYPVNVNRPAGEPTVVISHITTENEGPYVCTVTNACGTASRVVNVKVLA
ncbi:uncharacterized protein LOC128216323 [Mya arenaria]|uniref:uncharacterized protein LOC128216323 n=1 Tax=Mya arenaria TaxID=6604 RepID=UPI0022E5AEC1|nr:uncharacterized protein LOC128216323 [Mya arenaria]